MDRSVRLTAHGEELLDEQLARGTYHSAEEVVERALESLTQSCAAPQGNEHPRRTPAEAVASIREIQSRNRLNGLGLKDLINEGRKY